MDMREVLTLNFLIRFGHLLSLAFAVFFFPNLSFAQNTYLEFLRYQDLDQGLVSKINVEAFQKNVPVVLSLPNGERYLIVARSKEERLNTEDVENNYFTLSGSLFPLGSLDNIPSLLQALPEVDDGSIGIAVVGHEIDLSFTINSSKVIGSVKSLPDGTKQLRLTSMSQFYCAIDQVIQDPENTPPPDMTPTPPPDDGGGSGGDDGDDGNDPPPTDDPGDGSTGGPGSGDGSGDPPPISGEPGDNNPDPGSGDPPPTTDDPGDGDQGPGSGDGPDDPPVTEDPGSQDPIPEDPFPPTEDPGSDEGDGTDDDTSSPDAPQPPNDDGSEGSGETTTGTMGIQSVRQLSNDVVEPANEIDVLYAYTPKARAAAGGTKRIKAFIYNMISQQNLFLRQSGVKMRLRLVHTFELLDGPNETGLAMKDLTNLTEIDGIWDEIHTRRLTYGADVTTLIVDEYLKELDGTTVRPLCGVGWIPKADAAKEKMFNIVAGLFSDDSLGACGARVFAHELGHNLGLDHDHAHAVSDGSVFPDAYGNHLYIADKVYATIMSYLEPEQWSNGSFINYFSNSDIMFLGQPTGIVDYANEAHAINRISEFVTNYSQRTIVNIRGQVRNGSQPEAGVAILVAGNKVGVSGPDGKFNIMFNKGQAAELSIFSEGKIFSPASYLLNNLTDSNSNIFTLIKDVSRPIDGNFRITASSRLNDQELDDVVYYANGQVITDLDEYGTSYIDLLEGSQTVIQAFHPQFSFSPDSVHIKNIASNHSVVFQARSGSNWINGTVRTMTGAALPGVTILGNSGLMGESGLPYASSQVNGFYRLTNGFFGTTYQIKPELAGYHFIPPIATFVFDEAIETQDFIAIPGDGLKLQGQVVDQFNQPVASMAISLECSNQNANYSVDSIITDELGNFIFTGLSQDTQCKVIASKKGYSITSASTTLTLQSDTKILLTAERLISRISGFVRDTKGNPVPLVLISSSSTSVYTDHTGAYSIEINNGESISYIASLEGRFFFPSMFQFTSVSADSSDNNFTLQDDKVKSNGSEIVITKQPTSTTINTNGDIEINFNFYSPNGIAPVIEWQSRTAKKIRVKSKAKILRARARAEKVKAWSKWKAIPGANSFKLVLNIGKYRKGTHQVRAVIRDPDDNRVLRTTKPINISFKATKKSKK